MFCLLVSAYGKLFMCTIQFKNNIFTFFCCVKEVGQHSRRYIVSMAGAVHNIEKLACLRLRFSDFVYESCLNKQLNEQINRKTISEQRVNFFWQEMYEAQSGCSEKREIRQFQFTAWPDHGVPEHPTPLLMFMKRVKTMMSTDCGPTIVHCR